MTKAWICMTALLAGCAGQNASSIPSIPHAASAPAPSTQTVSALRGRGQVVVRIRVAHRHLHARYVSPSTKSLTLAFAGAARVTKTLGLTPGSPGCSAASGATICQIRLDLAAGKYTVDVSTYDQPPDGSGVTPGANLLSVAKDVPVTVIRAKDNTFGVTLEGVPASVEFGHVPSGAAGQPFSAPANLDFAALDADRNVIVGTYDAPITLLNSDGSGATTLATSGSDSPPASQVLSSSDQVTLNYTGLAIAPATISAASGSLALPGTLAFAPVLQPISIDTDDLTNHGFVGFDLTNAITSIAFVASEVGWTNSPYNRLITAVVPAACNGIGGIAPEEGTSFTATAAPGNPPPGECSPSLVDGAGQKIALSMDYTYFQATGTVQSIVVPPGVYTVNVGLQGAAGGPVGNTDGGLGANVGATIAVIPGETIYVVVGTKGAEGGGGYNGGGASNGGGYGGGATDIRVGGTALSNRIVVAGGGGGAGQCGTGPIAAGGNAGWLDGSSGDGLGGGGGTQTSGGVGGTPFGFAGTFGTGGGGLGCGDGGGGGGYYGGGSGGVNTTSGESGGGGGGSVFIGEGISGGAQFNNAGTGEASLLW